MGNFYERFAATAERYAAQTAVEVQRAASLEAFRYAELRQLAERAAGTLAARGIGPGDRCAILADNDAHWCAAYLGVLRLGGVAVPLDTAYKPKQIATLVRDSGAKILFTTPRYLDAARQAVEACGGAAEILMLDAQPEGCATKLPRCPAGPGDAAVILYTSGTTSDPKGVVLTHGNLLAEIETVLQVVDVNERDCILGVLPLFHALAQMANLLLPFAVGARVVFLESLSTSELLRALREREVSAFCCVPQFFYLIHQRVTRELTAAGWVKRHAFRSLLRLNGALRQHAGLNLGRALFRRVHDVLGERMRLLVTGGSRFDPAIGRDLYRLGFNILQAYGLTETSGAATVTHPGESRVDSVGPALPGVEVKILPAPTESGQAEAGPSENEAGDGEVAIRGPIVMQGYFNRPDANAAVLRDGWLHTGDLGRLDEAGRLHITGRKKEIIVLSSGKNIYPEEIEAHYLQSEYIKELCVLGVSRPEEPAAERLHAVVVPDFEVMRERKVVNTREWLRYDIEGLSIHLPSHKRILSYEVWTEELPRTTTRKLKRFEIERRVRERGAAADEPAAAARPLSEQDQAWAADPFVARALEVIGEAAKQKGARGEAGAPGTGQDDGATGAALRPDANIELELGLDSMERVELLTELQQLFGTQVPEDVAHRIYTVRELVEAVRPHEGAATTPAAEERKDAWGRLLGEAPQDDAVLTDLLRPRPLAAPLMFLLMKLCYAVARLLLRFRVTGREHLPQAPFLLCPNHQSYLDPFLLCCALPYRVFRNLFLVGASEYFDTPLLRRVARFINLVPVDPDANLVRAMQAGAFGLRHAKVLVLFPEGERSIDGTVKPFKKGAPILSLHLRAPIVPVAMDGVFDLWARGRPFRWRALLPGANSPPLVLRFGPAVAPPAALPANASLSEAEARYSAASDHLRATVTEMWQALRPS